MCRFAFDQSLHAGSAQIFSRICATFPAIAQRAGFVVSRVLTLCGCSLFGPCSLTYNQILAEGAKHIGEALKINKTLTSLECVPATPPQVEMRSLCCQQGG
eukprot:scaffold10094_cov128-Isochrysis_galbana.AAC.2